MSNRPDSWHKAQYEALAGDIRAQGHEPTPWEDLTETQRANIRKANDSNADFMGKLGKAITSGGPLPNPMED